MPTYTFRDINTDQIVEHVLRMSAYDDFTLANPHLERYHVPGEAPGVSDPIRLGIKQPSDGFKSLLKQIKINNPGSNINTY